FVPVTCVGVDAIGVTISYEGQTALIPVDARPDLVGQTLTLGIRPEHTRLSEGDINIMVTPSVIERLGINTIAYASLPNGEPYCALLPGSAPIRVEQPMVTGIMAADCHLFDGNGQALERRIDWRTLDLPASVTAAE
ncbi:MAG: TOBE domain-containing protein, partial [Allorhizobium sp.]